MRNFGSVPNWGKKPVTSPKTDLALGPIPPPMQEVTWALSSGVKWPGHDVDHSHTCTNFEG